MDFTMPKMSRLQLFCSLAILVPMLVNAAPSNNEKDMKGPVFTNEPLNKVDFSNSTGAVVECRASGLPPPEIIWVRSDGTAVGDVPGLRQVRQLVFGWGFELVVFIFCETFLGSSERKSRLSTVPGRGLSAGGARSSLRMSRQEPGRIHHLTRRPRSCR
jgi:hypothetical protein